MDLTTSYKILGIDSKADKDHVKRAYKAQVRRWHPDQFPEGSSLKAAADEQLKQINIAYTRVKSHLSRLGPAPSPHARPTDAPHQPRKASNDNKAHHQQQTRRSWVDHLFDTLNAFAGNRGDHSQTAADDNANPKQSRSFEQVLDEMTGGKKPTEKPQKRTAGRHTRRNYAEIYKKYQRQSGSTAGVEPMESKGPVKPVSRVRGIGRSR